MYYLYRHIRLDKNIPFYVGIGKIYPNNTFNCAYKRAFLKSQRPSHWLNIVNITPYRVDILMEDDNLDFIFQKEREFINLYGRSDLGNGTLVNRTDGGDGGFNLSDEQCKAISKRMIGNKNSLGYVPSDEQRRIVSERFKGSTTWRGRKHKESSKQLISAHHKNIPLSESHRKNTFNTKPQAKKIICLNNNTQYNSICECIRLLFGCNLLAKDNVFRNYKHQISFVCNGKKENYKGYKFKFI